MITAVDSSVLMAIAKDEPTGGDWITTLQEHASLGQLIVCDVVLAELSAFFNEDAAASRLFEKLGIEYEPASLPTAWLAGRLFHAYRRAGGPREHLIPDFLIGAHAFLQADQLAAVDRGYLRRYFLKLRVIGPGRSKSH